MENQKNYYIVKISDEELHFGRLIDDNIIEFNYNQILALYEDNNDGSINVGYPALAPYSPMLGNMYGYEKSYKKGCFLKLDSIDNYLINYHSVYYIEVSNNLTISTINGVNELGNNIGLFDTDSLRVLKKVVK